VPVVPRHPNDARGGLVHDRDGFCHRYAYESHHDHGRLVVFWLDFPDISPPAVGQLPIVLDHRQAGQISLPGWVFS
jgi:hypothetical protein